MKLLISKTELNSKRSRDPIPLECLNCGKTHYRPKNVILRILNGNLKNTNTGCYCSKHCKDMKLINSKIYQCKECGKNIIKTPSQINGDNIFCSLSCSATFFNRDKIVLKNCLHCKNQFHPIRGNVGKFCSKKCLTDNLRSRVFEKIEQGNVNNHSPSTMRNYLIYKRGQKCELCNITEWMGKPLVVILDHIDGNSSDNSLTNLRLICSNCDANLPTYKAKNKGKGRTYRRKNGATRTT